MIPKHWKKPTLSCDSVGIFNISAGMPIETLLLEVNRSSVLSFIPTHFFNSSRLLSGQGGEVNLRSFLRTGSAGVNKSIFSRKELE